MIKGFDRDEDHKTEYLLILRGLREVIDRRPSAPAELHATLRAVRNLKDLEAPNEERRTAYGVNTLTISSRPES